MGILMISIIIQFEVICPSDAADNAEDTMDENKYQMPKSKRYANVTREASKDLEAFCKYE